MFRDVFVSFGVRDLVVFFSTWGISFSGPPFISQMVFCSTSYDTQKAPVTFHVSTGFFCPANHVTYNANGNALGVCHAERWNAT